MSDFFGDIDQIMQEETTITQDLSQSVSKQEIITMISAITIFDKFSQDKSIWSKFYKSHLSDSEGFYVVNNFLEFSKLV